MIYSIPHARGGEPAHLETGLHREKYSPHLWVIFRNWYSFVAKSGMLWWIDTYVGVIMDHIELATAAGRVRVPVLGREDAGRLSITWHWATSSYDNSKNWC